MSENLNRVLYDHIKSGDVIIGETEGERYETVIIGTETPVVCGRGYFGPIVQISPGILRFTKFTSRHLKYGECDGFFWPLNKAYWESYFSSGKEPENKVVAYLSKDRSVSKRLLKIALA